MCRVMTGAIQGVRRFSCGENNRDIGKGGCNIHVTVIIKVFTVVISLHGDTLIEVIVILRTMQATEPSISCTIHLFNTHTVMMTHWDSSLVNFLYTQTSTRHSLLYHNY